MSWGKHFLEAATLIVAAVVCALVANAGASRERKLTLLPPAGGGQRAAGGPTLPTTATIAPPTTTAQPDNRTASSPAPGTRHPAPTTRQPKADDRQPIERFPPHPDKPYIEIHGDDVSWMHSKGVLFLDARRTSVYEQGHIASARPFSVWESDVDDKVNKLFAERGEPRQQELPIVIYCSGGDCEDSHMLAQKLWGIQFNNIYVYKDGFPDWQKRAGPIHTGPTP